VRRGHDAAASTIQLVDAIRVVVHVRDDPADNSAGPMCGKERAPSVAREQRILSAVEEAAQIRLHRRDVRRRRTVDVERNLEKGREVLLAKLD